MKDNIILRLSLKKAINNGWVPDILTIPTENYYLNIDIKEKNYYRMIFNHNFAKAFWGGCKIYDGITTDLCNNCQVKYCGELVLASLPAYLYHLQQMVLEEEPLKYLEKFLN